MAAVPRNLFPFLALLSTTALASVSLSIPRGAVYGLVGANGAGKTTLIKHVLGLLRAEVGSVRVFGQDPVSEPVAVLSAAVAGMERKTAEPVKDRRLLVDLDGERIVRPVADDEIGSGIDCPVGDLCHVAEDVLVQPPMKGAYDCIRSRAQCRDVFFKPLQIRRDSSVTHRYVPFSRSSSRTNSPLSRQSKSVI